MSQIKITCPVPDCPYETPEDERAVALQFLTIHGYSHMPGASTTPQQQQPERPRRPMIDMGCNSEKWSFFKSRWAAYKKLAKIPDSDCTDQLRQCCSEDLQLALFRAHGDTLDSKAKVILMSDIEKLAVEPEKEIVERVRLLNMKQDHDELVQSFVTRLRGQANMCKFIIKHKCSCNLEADVNYADLIVRDVLARGLADTDIQVDLLGATNQGMSLEETVEFVKTKESGKASATHLSGTLAASALRSSYKRSTKANQLPVGEGSSKGPKDTICSWCGKAGHGYRFRRSDRKGVCPAYGHRCSKCDKQHHFEDCCRKFLSKANASAIGTDHEGFLLGQDEFGTTLQRCGTVNHD